MIGYSSFDSISLHWPNVGVFPYDFYWNVGSGWNWRAGCPAYSLQTHRHSVQSHSVYIMGPAVWVLVDGAACSAMLTSTFNTCPYILTNWLTAGSRGLHEKLTVKKFPSFYETWSFIPAFTRTCHLFLRARSVHYLPSIPLLKYHFGIILPSVPVSSKRSLSFMFPHQNPSCICPLSAIYSTQLILLYFITRFLVSITDHKAPHCAVFPTLLLPHILGPNISLSTLLLNTLSLCSSFIVRHQLSRRTKQQQNYSSMYPKGVYLN
jgi:hypothetical protein